MAGVSITNSSFSGRIKPGRNKNRWSRVWIMWMLINNNKNFFIPSTRISR